MSDLVDEYKSGELAMRDGCMTDFIIEQVVYQERNLVFIRRQFRYSFRYSTTYVIEILNPETGKVSSRATYKEFNNAVSDWLDLVRE